MVSSELTTLAGAERLGRLINAFGVPLLLALFIGVYFGWVPSPLYTTVIQNQKILLEHDARSAQITADAGRERRELAQSLNRLADIIKMLDCGMIPDARSRERCLAR